MLKICLVAFLSLSLLAPVDSRAQSNEDFREVREQFVAGLKSKDPANTPIQTKIIESPAEVLRAAKSYGQVVVIFSSKGCGFHSGTLPSLLADDEFKSALGDTKVVVWHSTIPFKPGAVTAPGLPIPIEISPTFLWYEDGDLRDVTVGYNALRMKKLVGFLNRNQGKKDLYKGPSYRGTRTSAGFVKWLKRRFDGSYNFDGRVFDGLAVHDLVLDDSNLRNTSWEGASLARVVFSHSDLTNASFAGASFEDVLWGSCICPDGSRSEDHGYTCEGHLKPKNQEGTGNARF